MEGRELDARLLGGAALFGIGWGLAGLCPGPALASLARGDLRVVSFVAAMVAGMILQRRIAAPASKAAMPLPPRARSEAHAA